MSFPTSAVVDATKHPLALCNDCNMMWSATHQAAKNHGLPIAVMHGPFAAADMYKLQASRAKPRTSYACMPDTTPLYTALLEQEPGSYREKNAAPDHDFRLIVSTADANSDLGRNQIAHEINAGSHVRMHPNPPSFFWILDHTRIGIPRT